jgi:hypothetical protein
MLAAKRFLLLLVVLVGALGPTLGAAVLTAPGAHVATPASGGQSVAGVVAALAASIVVFGAIRIKDTGALAQKFATRASAAAGDYKDGVAQAGGDWETNAKNSESNYEQGVQEAIGDKRFGKGISDAGGAKYVKRATELGATRYGPGVNAGKDEWAKQTQPYLDKLKSLTLPPKGPRRSPQNQARANMVALELGKMRTGK